MKFFDDFMYGANCVLRGIRVFYSRPRLWPYALPPLLLVLLVYAGILAICFFLVVPWLRDWLAGVDIPGWLSWVKAVLNWSVSAFFWVGIPVLLLFLLGPLYEMFGNMLFDILVDAFEKEAYPEHPGIGHTHGRVVRLVTGYILLTVASYLLYFVLFCWIPVVKYVVRGAICGRSYLHDSAIRQDLPVSVLRRQVSKNRWAVFGFGIIACFAEMVPFLIPGLVIGGSILYHTRILDPADMPAPDRNRISA